MTFVFLLILVAVLTVIALVATGRISRPSPAEHDQRPTFVPTAPVTTESLRKARFGVAFRGYRMSEVDALIEQMLLTLEREDEASVSEVGTNTGGNRNVSDGHAE